MGRCRLKRHKGKGIFESVGCPALAQKGDFIAIACGFYNPARSTMCG
jgi:hypothetical protein